VAAARSSRLIAIGAIVCAVGVGGSVAAVRAADATAPPTSDAPVTAAPPDTGHPAAAPVAMDPETRLPNPLVVPDGHEAVAVQVAFDAGVAGVPGPGDRINVYGVFTSGRPGETATQASPGPQVQRVLVGVEVLGVAGGATPTTGGSPTYVLAVTPSQAEQVVFLHTAERLWMTLVGDDIDTATTGGRDHGSILR